MSCGKMDVEQSFNKYVALRDTSLTGYSFVVVASCQSNPLVTVGTVPLWSCGWHVHTTLFQYNVVIVRISISCLLKTLIKIG